MAEIAGGEGPAMVAWNERMNRAILNRFTEERSEGSVMKSLRSRLEALEVAARYVSGANQLDILLAAMGGDLAATLELDRLRTGGALAGRLGEIFDALQGPCETDQTAGPTP
jgi:hypothetical protein